jgi:hypothetical protein
MADNGSHVDTFLELVADNNESAIDVAVYIGGNFWNLL